jgi:hypothetical protein
MGIGGMLLALPVVVATRGAWRVLRYHDEALARVGERSR